MVFVGTLILIAGIWYFVAHMSRRSKDPMPFKDFKESSFVNKERPYDTDVSSSSSSGASPGASQKGLSWSNWRWRPAASVKEDAASENIMSMYVGPHLGDSATGNSTNESIQAPVKTDNSRSFEHTNTNQSSTGGVPRYTAGPFHS